MHVSLALELSAGKFCVTLGDIGLGCSCLAHGTHYMKLTLTVLELKIHANASCVLVAKKNE